MKNDAPPPIYRTLGRSGLVVSPLALGTMTFGTPRWGSSETEAGAVLDAYLAWGGNVIDTADVYSGGESESMVGRFLTDRGCRDDVVLATKFGFNSSSSPLEAHPSAAGRLHGGGSGLKRIRQALEASLRRLRTDYVDLYWMHIWDGVTPMEEIVLALSDLVREGKIRYYALSDLPAWAAMKAATLATERGLHRPVALQVEYSLVSRGVEHEHIPAAADAGMSVVPWSPLAGGFLSGKYTRAQPPARGRLSGANPFGDSKFTDRNWDVLDVVRAVAGELGRPPAQVALAWVMQRPAVGCTLVGARTVEQLRGNLDATSVAFTDEQRRRLDEASAPDPSFSSVLTSAPIRAMLFGGHTVRGWAER